MTPSGSRQRNKESGRKRQRRRPAHGAGGEAGRTRDDAGEGGEAHSSGTQGRGPGRRGVQGGGGDRARLAAWLASGALVLVAALALVRLGEWGGGADPRDPRQLALGARVYAEHCASCHGADLEGQPDWRQRRPDGRLPAPPHDETGHTWHHPDRHLFEVTKHGTGAIAPPGYRTNMIGFGDRLSDTEIWAALAFIKSAWPPEIRRRQEALNRTTR